MFGRKRGDFVMKGTSPGLINTYWCRQCLAAGRRHQVIDLPGPSTDQFAWCGSRVPTVMRKCTKCGGEDGPWIRIDNNGDQWCDTNGYLRS